MADSGRTPVSSMSDEQLREQLSKLYPKFLSFARERWFRIGSPAELDDEDLVHSAVERLLKLPTLPDVPLLTWMCWAIRSISSNEAKKRRRRAANEAYTQAGEPTDAQVQARALSMFEVVLGWLRVEAATAGDAEMEAVLDVFRYEEFNESEVASCTGLSVERVRACKQRIKRLLRKVPQRIQDAIDDELGRTP